MLSPGKWHQFVPGDEKANVTFRLDLLKRAKGDKVFQRGLRAICRDDLLFFINAFVWQKNVRKPGDEVGPFVTWECQDQWLRALLDCIECHCHESDLPHQHDMLWEKSREMGATWLFLIVAVWLAVFHRNKDLLMISKSEKAVDDPSMNSLFARVDYILKYLPGWLKGPVIRKKLHFSFPWTDSSIDGEASTGRAGVGGRATVMFIDEFSQIAEDFQVLHRTSDTTGCRLFNGTHLGAGTAFYELSQRPDLRKQVMHWSQHPDKKRGLYRYDEIRNQIEVIDKGFKYPASFQFAYDVAPAGGPHPGIRSPWYDDQCRRKNDRRAVAMDLDIDPHGSVSQVFDAGLIRSLVGEYCREPCWEGHLSFDHDAGRPLGLIPTQGGLLRLWINPRDGEIPAGEYSIGVDLSEGVGATPTCFSILNCRTGERVGEYTDPNIKINESAAFAVALCWLFKNEQNDGAYLIWEHVGPGVNFSQRVVDSHGYRRVYWRRNEHRLLKKPTDTPGWYPTPELKDVLIKDYHAALFQRQFINFSKAALLECLKFKYNVSGHVEHTEERAENKAAATINHGDHVIADALAWKMAKGKLEVVKKQEKEKVVIGSLQWRRDLAEASRREKEWV